MRGCASVLVISIVLAAAGCSEGPGSQTGRPARAQTPEQEATALATSWLALLDGEQYEASWDQAAPYLQKQVTKEKWCQSMKSGRKPLGKLISRRRRSATFATTMPGAPDGEYVVVEFVSTFDNRKAAFETVTPMKGADGAWSVSGYYLK